MALNSLSKQPRIRPRPKVLIIIVILDISFELITPSEFLDTLLGCDGSAGFIELENPQQLVVSGMFANLSRPIHHGW